MVTLLTIGESMGVAATSVGTPLVGASQLRLSTAGAEATVAVGMQRLGHTAAWVGTVGADEIGRRVVRDLQAEGVDTRFVRTVPHDSTGFMLRDHRSSDFVAVSYYRKNLAGALLSPDDVDRAFDGLATIDLLHLTGITPLLSASCRAAVHRALDRAADQGTEVSFDVNYRRALGKWEEASREAREIAQRTDILFVGDDEIDLLTQASDPIAAARDLHELGPAEVVVKKGAAGAYAATEASSVACAALQVSAVDVIGAGDSFVAGYLAARAHGCDLDERLRWATVCAACTVGTHGYWEGLPTRTELDQRARLGVTLR